MSIEEASNHFRFRDDLHSIHILYNTHFLQLDQDDT